MRGYIKMAFYSLAQVDEVIYRSKLFLEQGKSFIEYFIPKTKEKPKKKQKIRRKRT